MPWEGPAAPWGQALDQPCLHLHPHCVIMFSSLKFLKPPLLIPNLYNGAKLAYLGETNMHA